MVSLIGIRFGELAGPPHSVKFGCFMVRTQDLGDGLFQPTGEAAATCAWRVGISYSTWRFGNPMKIRSTDIGGIEVGGTMGVA